MYNINIMTEHSNKSSSANSNKSSSANKSSSSNSNKSSPGIEQYETIRIIITYIVVFFMIMALMATNGSNDSLLITSVISISYLLICALFDFIWMKYFLVENRVNGDKSERTGFHNILHLILPGIVILFGYSFLLSGFNSVLDPKNYKSLILFLIKLISIISIIVGYVYYSIRLKEVMDDSSDKNLNTQVDILYSILHPIAILIISAIFYLIILFFINRKRSIPSNLPKLIPSTPPLPSPSDNVNIDINSTPTPLEPNLPQPSPLS